MEIGGLGWFEFQNVVPYVVGGYMKFRVTNQLWPWTHNPKSRPRNTL